ncbi:unnamed protein product [Calypogeia fissa]
MIHTVGQASVFRILQWPNSGAPNSGSHNFVAHNFGPPNSGAHNFGAHHLDAHISGVHKFGAHKQVIAHNWRVNLRTTAPQCRSRTPQQEGERGTRQRGAKQEQRRLQLDSYRSRFTRALEAELTEEMVTMKDRIKTWSKKRLQDEGLALFDLSVRPDGQLYKDTVLRFYNSQGNGFLPTYHEFSHGDVVAISRRNPLESDDSAVEGVVMERARRFLRVVVPSRQAGDIDQRLKWRLDLSANRVAYERCLWAVHAFSSPQIRPGLMQQQPSTNNNSSKSSSKVSNSGISPDSLPRMGEGVMSFRDMIIEAESTQVNLETLSEGGETNDGSIKSPMRQEALKIRSTAPSKVGGKNLGAYKSFIATFLQDLEMDINSSQKTAIQKALCSRVTLWQGPPGTGKTRTLVRLIKGFCKHGQGKVLACADSNVAVDNLVEGLLEQGLRVVRVGQPVKVKEELRNSTVAAQVSAHPLMKKVKEYREEAMVKRRAARQFNNEKKRKAGAIESTGLWDKASDLEKEAVKAVLDRADVIAATCVGAGDPILDDRHFRACVIDEATQATEPATLIPILRSGADTIVLVGDPAQLPPTVISRDALDEGLSKSLFEHLQECGMEPLLLDTQYRMHPFLASWPSQMFYGNRLLSHVKPSERPIPAGLAWPNKSKPLVFIDYANGSEQTTAFGNSYFNRREALQVVQVVDFLLKEGDLSCIDVGVISPYSAQIRLLQDLFLEGETAEKGSFADLEVMTVDGFQGREKEVIVISTVRSNVEDRLGFVTDPRRMNVALTRAKRGLVVVGDSKTLQSGYHWGLWLQMIRKERILLERTDE